MGSGFVRSIEQTYEKSLVFSAASKQSENWHSKNPYKTIDVSMRRSRGRRKVRTPPYPLFSLLDFLRLSGFFHTLFLRLITYSKSNWFPIRSAVKNFYFYFHFKRVLTAPPFSFLPLSRKSNQKIENKKSFFAQ